MAALAIYSIVVEKCVRKLSRRGLLFVRGFAGSFYEGGMLLSACVTMDRLALAEF